LVGAIRIGMITLNVNERKNEFIVSEIKRVLEVERLELLRINKMNLKRFWGYFLVVLGFAISVFVLLNLLFDSQAIHHFYLLCFGIGATVSVVSGVFILPPSE